MGWLSRHVHDPGGIVLRRGVAAGVTVTAVYALGVEVVDDSTFALFAAFSGFAVYGLVWFGGTTAHRAAGYLSYAATGVVLVAVGTWASDSVLLGIASMFVVGFAVRYLAVFGGYLAAGTNAVLLAYVLPVMVPDSASSGLWSREAGWLVGSLVGTAGVLLVVRDRSRDELRGAIAACCRRTANVVEHGGARPDELAALVEQARGLEAQWASRPQHPAGPGLHDQALLSVLELVNRMVLFVKNLEWSRYRDGPIDTVPLETAIIDTLRGSADLLERRRSNAALDALEAVRTQYRDEVRRAIDDAREQATADAALDQAERSYPLLVVSHIALSIGANAMLLEGSTVDETAFEMVPDVPADGRAFNGALRRARRLLRVHLKVDDATFRASVRTAALLAAAVYLADLLADALHVTHKFWVVLGTLAVLRSNATATATTGAKAVIGTVVGFALSIPVLYLSEGSGWLWLALAITVVLAAYAPSAIGFAVGQISFTLFVVVLFTISQPLGNATGEQRVLTVVCGAGVAVVGGLFLWPRGAVAVIGSKVAAFVDAGRDYLRLASARFFIPEVTDDEAIARARRATQLGRWAADDAFSGLVAEHRSSPEVTLAWVRLICMPTAVRQVADGVASLPGRGYGCCDCPGAQRAARRELARVGSSLAAISAALAEDAPAALPPTALDLDGARAELRACLHAQRQRPEDERESVVGLLWVVEGLAFLDQTLERMRATVELVRPGGGQGEAVPASARST